MDSPSTKSRVALTPAELAPDVQQHDESDEQQAQHEDRCRATAQREPQPLRMGVAEPGVASSYQASDFGSAYGQAHPTSQAPSPVTGHADRAGDGACCYGGAHIFRPGASSV